MNPRFRPPNTIVLIVGLLLVLAVLTWFIPGGTYERVEANGRQVVDPGSFTYVESNPAGVREVAYAVYKGFTDPYVIAIVLFIFAVAGAFSVIRESGVFERVIRKSARFFHENPAWRRWFVPSFMLMFSVMGTTFGMSEEVLVFVPLFLALALALGYDSITGVAIPFVGAGLGFAGAIYNPFTVGVAQGLAEITLYSASGFRFLLWVCMTATGIWLVARYAASVYKNPKSSPVYELDQNRERMGDEEMIRGDVVLNRRDYALLLLFFGTLLMLIVGVTQWGWYITELTWLFVALGVSSAVVTWLPPLQSGMAFLQGVREVLLVAVIIALSRAILILATEAEIVDTVLYAMSSGLSSVHPVVSAQLMLFVQSAINFFVPSGSGQAALTIPVMAPLGDIVGISRQAVVLVFQLGDGLTNLIIPTSGVTMGVLVMAKITWDTWARWLFPRLVVLFLVAMAFTALAVFIGLE